MLMQEVQKDDIGTVLEITIKDQDNAVVNLASATTTEVIFKKPGGTKVTKTATFVSDGSDGQIRYAFVDGDLDIKGIWRFQGYIVLPNGEWYTSIREFKVIDNL